MSECEYCGQENAVIEIDSQFFHNECYSNFLKEGKIKKRNLCMGFFFIAILLWIVYGLISYFFLFKLFFQ
jgi:predicted nucleic acid-binding Zn ribbon protein